MQINDPIADMLTRLRNAAQRGRKDVRLPHSKLKERIAQLLVQEGYLDSVSVEKGSETTAQNDLVLMLKYLGNKPALNGLVRVSRPSVRVYVRHDQIPNIKNGLGICILSTSKGILTGFDAKKEKAGGELLCNIW